MKYDHVFNKPKGFAIALIAIVGVLLGGAFLLGFITNPVETLIMSTGGLIAFGLMGATQGLTKAVNCTAAVSTAFVIGINGADDNTYSVATGGTDKLVGVFQHTTTAVGERIRIMLDGISEVVYGGTVTRGDPLTSNATGLAIKATLGQNIIGYATVSGVLNDVGFVNINPTVLGTDISADGLQYKGVARGTLDATSGLSIASHGLGVTLPDNAVVTRAFLEVITTFTSATDAATIALGLPTDDVAGIVAAIAIDDGTNPWDAGYHEGIQTGTAANFAVKTTAAREVTADVAVEALTDGKAIVWLEYVVSE